MIALLLTLTAGWVLTLALRAARLPARALLHAHRGLLVLALIGLTFLFKSYAVGIGASLLATGVMLLELFVAFLQAFVFTLLTSVFIGLMRAEH